MRPMLLGRDVERARVLRVLEAPAGRGASCWLSGPSGIGKSALLGAVADEAQRAGMPVLWGRCDTGVGDVPFWPWLDVLRSRADSAGDALAHDLAEAGPALLRAMPDLSPLLPGVVPAAAPSRFAVSAGIRSWLSRTGSGTRALVVLDDLHDADPDSLQLLLAVVRDLDRLPVSVVGAFQPSARPEVADLLYRCVREGDHVVLGPLSEADVVELGCRTTDGALSRGQLCRVVEVSEGSPFLVLELCAWLLAVPAGADRLPPGLLTLAARRLAPLTAQTRDVLDVLAVTGGSAPVSLLARVLERPVPAVVALLDGAVREGVLVEPAPGVVSFAHRLVLDAVLGDLAPSRRARLHRAVADVLERSEPAADPATLAAHWLGSAVLDPARALRATLAAARSAMERAAPAAAAEQLERALQLFPDVLRSADGSPVPAMAEVQLALAQARWAAGDLAGADAAAWAVARTTEDVEIRARAALALGGRIVVTGPPSDDHVDLLEGLLHELDPTTTPALHAQLLARRGQLECLRPVAGAVDDAAVPRCQEALRLSQRSQDPAAQAVALFMLHFALDDPRRLSDRLSLSERFVAVSASSGDSEWQVHALLFRAVDLLGAGRWAEMRAVLDRHAPLVQRLQHPLFIAAGHTSRSSLALAEGRLDDAELWAQRALDALTDFPDPHFRLLALSHLLEVSRERGRPEQHRADLDLAAAGSDHPLALVLQALCAAECEDHDVARALLRRLALDDFAAVPGWTATGMAALLTDAVLALGAVPLGRQLEPRLLGTESLVITMGRPCAAPRGTGARPLARLARLRGDLDAAVALGRRAVADAAGLQAPVWQAGAAAELAAALRERGRSGDHSEAARLDRQASRLRAEALPVPAPRAPAVAVASMHRHGTDWEVLFQGRPVGLRDSTGARHLSRLLADPGRELHVLDLVAAPAPAAVPERTSVPRHQDDLGPTLDREALHAYRRRLHEVERDVEEAQLHGDGERSARARAERDFLLDELSAATGLHGRGRPTGSRVERARSTATHAVRRAIARVAATDETLGSHLARAVSTGTYFSYRP